MENEKLTTRKKIAYGVGNVGGLAIGQSSILLLYTYYFLYIKVPLSPIAISAVLVVYGIWDAFNEPIIGHLSDLTRTRWGRRKPFIAAGVVPLIVFSVLIYTPPLSDPWASGVYLIIVLVLYEAFITMVVTSWYSLYPEITLDEGERVDLSKFLQIFGILGLVLGLGVAPMIAGSFSSYVEGYSIMGLVIGLVTLASMVPTLLTVRERHEYQISEEDRVGFLESIKMAFKSRSFRYFVIVQFLLQLAYALVVSSLPLFFEGILGLESLQWSVLLLATFLSVLPSLFLWMKVAEKRGAKKALEYSIVAFAVVFPMAFLMVNPVAALVVLLLAGIGLAGLMMFPTVLLGDVIDEDQVTSNKRREGIFTGVSGVIVKLSSAISWAVMGVVITLFQIDRNNLKPDLLTPLNALGLQVLVGVIPVVVILMGLIFLRHFPLAGSHLAEVREKVKMLDRELMSGKEENTGKA
ncbi:MAG: MFS transporter [Promethearchaeota archaeon]